MMTTFRRGLPVLALLTGAACVDNPVLAPHDDHGEELDVALTFSEQHLATLTELEIEVEITGHDGASYTDFIAVAVEFKLEGEESWVARELELHGSHFSAEHTFYSSGDYEARVVAQRHGADHSETIFERDGHLEVERIHKEVGEYRIEMETFPGHLHEGDEAEVKFWILEASDGQGSGHSIGGLTADIHLSHVASGDSMSYRAEEHTTGVYEAHHVFAEHGETEVMIEFEDEHGAHHTAAFRVHVDDSH